MAEVSGSLYKRGRGGGQAGGCAGVRIWRFFDLRSCLQRDLGLKALFTAEKNIPRMSPV